MFCSQCGNKNDGNFKYCPNCGAKLDPSAAPLSAADAPSNLSSSSANASSSSAPLVKKKRMPFWFKLLALLSVLALIAVTAGILFTESLVDVVDLQLSALREDDISKAYYAYTSKDFQAATTLDQFRQFIHAYPVFASSQSAHFTQRAIEHNIGTLKGNLTSNDHVQTPIEYKLIKEDKWKILSIRLLKPGNIQNGKDATQTEDLIDVAKSQLKDIQNQKITAAYENYSSTEFKEATSETAFQDFIKRYPILADHRVISFHKPTIRNGVGTLSVILQSDQVAAYVKYYLIYEEQSWKIWSMRILSPSEEQEEETPSKRVIRDVASDTMSFGAVSVGEKVNTEGLIENSQQTFAATLQDLYVDIEIKNGIKGSIVYLSLQHLESGSSIPAKAVIEEEGDTLLMSVFSPPTTGWPKGLYKLVITTSSGLNKMVDFTIEDSNPDAAK